MNECNNQRKWHYLEQASTPLLWAYRYDHMPHWTILVVANAQKTGCDFYYDPSETSQGVYPQAIASPQTELPDYAMLAEMLEERLASQCELEALFGGGLAEDAVEEGLKDAWLGWESEESEESEESDEDNEDLYACQTGAWEAQDEQLRVVEADLDSLGVSLMYLDHRSSQVGVEAREQAFVDRMLRLSLFVKQSGVELNQPGLESLGVFEAYMEAKTDTLSSASEMTVSPALSLCCSLNESSDEGLTFSEDDALGFFGGSPLGAGPNVLGMTFEERAKVNPVATAVDQGENTQVILS